MVYLAEIRQEKLKNFETWKIRPNFPENEWNGTPL